MQLLPASMQARIAAQQHRQTVYRNMHLFSGCSTQFMERLMVMLIEVSLMPGETVLKAGEISRKLSFCQQGSLRVTDSRGTLIELIIGEVRCPLCVLTWHIVGMPPPPPPNVTCMRRGLLLQ